MLTRKQGLSRSPIKAKKAADTESARGETTANVRLPRKALKQTRHVIPRHVREAVIRRSQGRCEAPVHAPECMGVAQHVHHRKLLSQGGGSHPTNLAHLSNACHSYAHLNRAWGEEHGLIVPSWWS